MMNGIWHEGKILPEMLIVGRFCKVFHSIPDLGMQADEMLLC